MKKHILSTLKSVYILSIFLFVLSLQEISATNFLYSNLEVIIDENTQNSIENDSIQNFLKLAKFYSDKMDVNNALFFTRKYIRYTSDLSIINDHFFSSINRTDQYINFKNSYKLRFNFLSVFYLFAGFFGFFVFVILNLKKGINRASSLLISLFVLLHSLFIIHLSLYLINGHYYFPNTLLISTTFTLLYGPLIYFYFKIVDANYKLKPINAIHLLPALILLIYIFPFYMLTTNEKFIILFDQIAVLEYETKFIAIAKILSLVFYAVLTLKIYKASNKKSTSKDVKLLWQRNIVAIYILYVFAFLLYMTITLGFFDTLAFFHFQIVVMVMLVFYVAYIAYVQPEIFKGEVKLVDPINLFKYKTSNLTPSYSEELKNSLLKILREDKIYKENNISLQILSEKLGTSRHNTSQIINEHFNLNFFELINKYRIIEAVEIFDNNYQNSLNIIEVAYKVGFNNKVTFNKSFKKHLSQTPSDYLKTLRNNNPN